MPLNKYISTKDAVRLTGLSTEEIYDLIHSGTLPARKAPKRDGGPQKGYPGGRRLQG